MADTAIAPRLETNRKVHEDWKNDLVFSVIFLITSLVFLGIGGNLYGAVNVSVPTTGTGQVFDGPFSYASNSPMCKPCPENPSSISCDQTGSGRRLTEEEHSRRLQAANEEWNVWRVFEEAPEMMVLIVMVFVIGIIWVQALERFSKPLIYATALLKPVVFALLGVWQSSEGAETSVVIIYFVLAGISLAMFIAYRSKYDLSAKIMETSCECLKENKGIWGVSFTLKAIYLCLLFYYTFSCTRSYLIWEWVDVGVNAMTPGGTGDCILMPAVWAQNHVTFLSVTFIWITYYFAFARLVVVATGASNWYYHGDQPVLESPALEGAKWAFTTSSGVIAFSGLIMTGVEQIKRQANSKLWWTNPWGCLLKIAVSVLATCIEVLSKFLVIIHVLTAANFCESGKKTYHLIKKRFMGALIVDQASSDFLHLGEYVFSVAMMFVTWSWADTVAFGGPTTLSGGSVSYFVYLFIIMGVIFTYYPMGGIFFVAFISSIQFGSFGDDPVLSNVGKLLAPPLAGIFVGCISHIIFAAMAEVILHCIDSVFICYAVEKDSNAPPQDARFGGDNSLYVVLAETPAMKKFDESAGNIAGTVGMVPVAVATPVGAQV
jgi:hypothetical protein